MGIWDKYKFSFTDPNQLHNKESMEGIFEGTGLMILDLDQDQQNVLKNKTGNFDEAHLQKSYAQS